MIVHKSVYTAFYFAFAKYFVDNMLRGNEGRTANGRYYKLKSESIWNAKRVENGSIAYVISPVLGNHGDWRIFYRTLYLFDTKPGDNNRVLDTDYQMIDGYVFANALGAMGIVMPLVISEKLSEERVRDKEQDIIDNIVGEVLLNLFIQKRHPDLQHLLKDEFYDFSCNKIKVRHELPIILKSKTNTPSGVFPKAKTQVEALIFDFLQFTTCKRKMEENFNACHPAMKQREFQNDLDIFSKSYDEYFQIDQLHTWDFRLSLGSRNSAQAIIKIFFRMIVPLLWDTQQNPSEWDKLFNPDIHERDKGTFDSTYTYLSNNNMHYYHTAADYAFFLGEVELMYCDNRWYLNRIVPISL